MANKIKNPAAGRTIPRKLITVFFAALMGACVSGPGKPGSGVDMAASARQEKPARGERTLPADGLESARFEELPGEAKIYLKTLSEAFRLRDREFLLSQGEAQYEEELRAQYDDGTYLAMLYRTGNYSLEPVTVNSGLPKLEYTKIRGIEYTEWSERGPMLEIQARLHMENGEPLPCEIMLAWRLLEPKIVGFFP